MKPRVKFAEGSTSTLDILAVPFGGPFNGKDTDGEYFSAKTDLCLDWYPTSMPLLWHHGLDDGPGVAVIGYVDSTTARKDDDGWWVRAQLDQSSAYHSQIKQLIDQSVVYASSGAMPHLVRKKSTGEITRWPFCELSLTPTPANLFATVAPADVAKHYKSAGLAFKAESIPAIGDDGDAPEGSLEDLLQDLTRALNAGSMFAAAPFGDAYCYPVATFLTALDAGYTVVKVCSYDYDGEADQPPFYRVEFTIGPDLEPVLGAATPYDLAYVPASPEAAPAGEAKSGTPLDATPLVLAAELARNLAAVVAARTKDVQARRVKSGRVLSTANRQRLQALADAMKAAQGDLEELLTSTDPPAKASADVLRRLELRHRTLAMQERS